MNISNGISEISHSAINKNNQVHKTYIWPEYKSDKVKPINPVKRKLQNENLHYTKPAQPEHDKLLQKALNKPDLSYSAKGKINSNPYATLKPGSFFNALA
jgi:hypothetical protein